MLQSLSNFGAILNKNEQIAIHGGKAPVCPYPLEAMYNPSTGEWTCC